MNSIIAEKYVLGKEIGSGSFGKVHIAVNTETSESVAVKLEEVTTKKLRLQYESKVYRLLQGGVGVPTCHWYGCQDTHNVLVLDLLGPSLDGLFKQHNKQFSLKTVLTLAEQLVSRLEFVHSRGFIHRDIKPGNFLMGTSERAGEVFIVDFGLTRRYRHSKTREHVAYREGKSLVGTALYVSLNTHAGIEQARRDDMESLAYVLIQFLKGSLPWQGLGGTDRPEKYRRIFERKANTSIADLCQEVPEELATYLEYTRSLQFTEQPNYAYLQQLISAAAARTRCAIDGAYDWTPEVRRKRRKKKGKKSSKKSKPLA